MAGFTLFSLPDRIDEAPPPEGVCDATYLNTLSTFAESKADLVGSCFFSSTAPLAADGVVGQKWHNSATNLMHTKTGASTWNVGQLFGEPGADGIDGTNGTSYDHAVVSVLPATLEPNTVYFVRGTPTPVSYATVGGRTITTADLLAQIMVRNCGGAARTDTLPTAAQIVAALTTSTSTPVVGQIISCLIINGSGTLIEALTIAAGAGGSFNSNQSVSSRIIPQNASKTIRLRLTNVGSGTETYQVYL